MTRFEVWGEIVHHREGCMFPKYETKLLGRFTYHKDAVKFSKTCYRRYRAIDVKIKRIDYESK